MKRVLEELWFGNTCPPMWEREASAEAKQLREYIARHHEHLYAMLTEEQKVVLEKFNECCAELTDMTEREIFVYAFRLGARIAIEVMSFDEDF